MIARIAAIASLICAIVVVALVLLGGGSGYTLHADFKDASGLVTGDQVLIGPATVGSVKSIGLTSSGAAGITIGLDSNAAPMHQGTVARIYQNSLSGIANKYLVLEPGPSSAPTIPSGGRIPETQTYSDVSLDQVFDSLTPATRAGLRDFIRGQGASIQGRAAEAHRTLLYFAPGLESTSAVTAELARDEPAFDGLLVKGAQAFQALASRSQELSDLIANTSTTTAAIAAQSQALQQALVLFPGSLTHSTRTFAGLNKTLDTLDPLVAASKPAVRHLGEFASGLNSFINIALPTLGSLNALIHNPAGTGDLTTLAQQTPALAQIGAVAFPRLTQQMNDSQNQLDYLREYTPDVIAAITNLGQIGAYYDANGHYVRAQPVFNTFGVNGANQLTATPPFNSNGVPQNTYNGLHVVRHRCPGSAMQPSPDSSAPRAVPGCNPTQTPPGP